MKIIVWLAFATAAFAQGPCGISTKGQGWYTACVPVALQGAGVPITQSQFQVWVQPTTNETRIKYRLCYGKHSTPEQTATVEAHNGPMDRAFFLPLPAEQHVCSLKVQRLVVVSEEVGK